MRRLTLALADEAALDRLAAAPRPLGMRRGRTTYELLRWTYFDSPGGDLAERGLVLCVAVDASGGRTARLTRRVAVNLEGVVDEEVLSTEIGGGGLYATLRGASQVARAVREVLAPEALRPLMALDVDREVQELRPRLLARPTHRATFDRIQVHAGGDRWPHHQVSLVESAPGRITLEELADRVDGGGVALRRDARESVLERLAGGGSGRAARARGPVLSLVAVSDGMVALRPGARGFSLPTCERAGESEALRLADEVLAADPDTPPDVDLVGFTSTADGADAEVWLAEGVAAGGDGPTVWMPLSEVLERAGAPGLRDTGLVEALLLLVRSRVGHQLLREWAGRRGGEEWPRTVVPRDPGVPIGAHPEDFLDADLSILDFNLRVLEMAEDPDVPLLERFRFLGIFASNLDEFFVVRVARLKTHADRGAAADDAALPPDLLLDAIAVRARALLARQDACLRVLLAALAARGVRLREWSGLSAVERTALSEWFGRDLFPALTPRAMTGSSGQPFPRVESLSLSLAVLVGGPGGERPHIAHVPIPTTTPRFVPVPGSSDLIPVEEVVAANASSLFPGSGRVEAHPFRVSRISDVTVDSDLSESLLASVADEVADRRYQPVLRLEVGRTMPREVRAHLLRELRAEAAASGSLLGRGDVYEADGLLDLTGLGELVGLPVDGGLHPPFRPHAVLVDEASMFDRLGQGDLLVHHPYDGFDDSVGRFLDEAARDPAVVSIRMTLYRTGRDARVVQALLAALEAGKDVSVFVELQARFDEEQNIEWTHRLRSAGGHVVYGVPGFKTHAKTALVVRREADGRLARYCHIGTGNYNATTARVYTDFGLFTADEALGAELNDFFNELTGASGPPVGTHERLWVAPHTMAGSLLERIGAEVEHARAGRPCGIQAKLNGLSDRAVVRGLYEASAAGVPVDLVVRAICTLRPGVPGLSEGIQVRSILGRFLEHARVYRFENGGDPLVYVGSADWRKRNLRRRVEVAVRIDDEAIRRRLEAILAVERSDPRAWLLGPDGRYRREHGTGATAQETFMARAASGTASAP